jgi:hypothetical protein
MENSEIVWAEVYELVRPISQKEGTYDKDNPSYRKLIRNGGPMLRSYVEQRNAHVNNELIIIDEEKTLELVKNREAKAKEALEKKAAKKVSGEQIAGALTEILTKATDDKKAPEPKKRGRKPKIDSDENND